jgi:general secretion pathway protein D
VEGGTDEPGLVGQDEEEEIPETPEGKEYSWGGEPVVVPDRNLNAVIVIAPEYMHMEIVRILEKLDVRRPQVLFEVAIIDISADRDLDLGIEFSTIDPFSENPRGHGLTSFGIGKREDNPAGGFPATTTVPAGDRGIFAGISKGAAGSLPVLVKLLQQNSDVNIRSTPLLLVNDNEEAEFSSLRSEPTTSTSQGTATTRVSFAGFVDAGTVLTITPHVSEGNYIRLEISLQVDSWLGTSTTPGIPPPKATNSLDTSITVPNERTVIIGGLSSLTRSNVVEKVPLLGDIPILGWLFRREVTEERSTKLFLFIKPTILSDEKFIDLNKISGEKIKEAEKLAEK